MKKVVFAILVLAAFHSFGQGHKINLKLKSQLDSIGVLDQKYRNLLFEYPEQSQKDSIAKTFGVPTSELWDYIQSNMMKTDSSNLVFIEEVFSKYGYPGKTLVGAKTNEVAWNVIQHSEKIPQYIDIIKKAGIEKELPYTLVAMMEDRYLMNQKKEQIYGTQACGGCLSSGDNYPVIWPIKDPKNVNKRRKEAGFEQTVEENAKRMSIEYRVVTLSEVK
ncbi:DUF6624 domain-containing protein [Pontibacter russatus]|uniref:DUF6624 domain-containing protein n=1 Tax=Pontibacter russatus TaxID=2694929 RepID=UPI00137AE1DF|nr:DUF6624 domain-containing protein [Pontibacter russatus]